MSPARAPSRRAGASRAGKGADGSPRFREDLLEALSNAPGVSGDESAVRSIVVEAVRYHVDSLEVDAMGSLVAQIGVNARAHGRANGRGNGRMNGSAPKARTGPHVMLCAHLDEVGIMITAIEKEGRLRFRRAGGIDPRIMAGQVFRIGPRAVRGVVGILPPHLTSSADEEKVIPFDDLYLDIGAASREEAAEHVARGDTAVFDTVYEAWGSTRKGKAFDDRAGCAVLASLVQAPFPVPVTAVWSVQEEVGLRGATAAARRVSPDLAIVLEGTASGEAPGASEAESAPRMGAGPVLTVHDRTLMADARLVDILRRTATARRIPTQWKRPGVGGTDAGKISLSGSGVPSAVVSVACRYIHAPAAYLDARDTQRVVDLVWHTLHAIGKEWSER